MEGNRHYVKVVSGCIAGVHVDVEMPVALEIDDAEAWIDSIIEVSYKVDGPCLGKMLHIRQGVGKGRRAWERGSDLEAGVDVRGVMIRAI
jgi:hypothetical protein